MSRTAVYSNTSSYNYYYYAYYIIHISNPVNSIKASMLLHLGHIVYHQLPSELL